MIISDHREGAELEQIQGYGAFFERVDSIVKKGLTNKTGPIAMNLSRFAYTTMTVKSAKHT